MKKADKVYRAFVETAKYLIKELDYYGVKQFKQKESEQGWSIGQVYDHLIFGTQNYHIREIQNCLNKTKGSEKGGKTFKGRVFFMLGSFPPAKFKGKDAEGYQPGQPSNTVNVKDNLYRFVKVMNQVAREIDAAGEEGLKYKTMNPSLGMLNALEWYKLIEMHFRHHLKQKQRLDKIVRSYMRESLESQRAAALPGGKDDFDPDLL
ncbi:DinB family protein [Cytophagaceae bacterium ABcell3]|nr:DinB family protein [Cytophagaceae bacterium ABcell3]